MLPSDETSDGHEPCSKPQSTGESSRPAGRRPSSTSHAASTYGAPKRPWVRYSDANRARIATALSRYAARPASAARRSSTQAASQFSAKGRAGCARRPTRPAAPSARFDEAPLALVPHGPNRVVCELQGEHRIGQLTGELVGPDQCRGGRNLIHQQTANRLFGLLLDVAAGPSCPGGVREAAARCVCRHDDRFDRLEREIPDGCIAEGGRRAKQRGDHPCVLPDIHAAIHRARFRRLAAVEAGEPGCGECPPHPSNQLLGPRAARGRAEDRPAVHVEVQQRRLILAGLFGAAARPIARLREPAEAAVCAIPEPRAHAIEREAGDFAQPDVSVHGFGQGEREGRRIRQLRPGSKPSVQLVELRDRAGAQPGPGGLDRYVVSPLARPGWLSPAWLLERRALPRADLLSPCAPDAIGLLEQGGELLREKYVPPSRTCPAGVSTSVLGQPPML